METSSKMIHTPSCNGDGGGGDLSLGINKQNGNIFVNNNITNNYHEGTTSFNNHEDDDEEWYPPSPPVYDVTDKLIEINRMLYDDPASLIRNGPG